MFQWLTRYRDLTAVVVGLLLPGILLYAQSRSDAEAGPAVRAILRLMAPMQDAVSQALVGAADTWEDHWHDARVVSDARRLRADMAGLRAQADRANELERENNRLRALLHAHPAPAGATLMAARVVAVGASPAYRTVRVDVGRDDGIRRGMVALAPEGALGSVLRTGHAYSDVLLISDRQSAVDVVLPRSGARGILHGPGAEADALLRIEGLDRTDDVKPGDEVVANGMGARFPRGTRIGTVVEVEQVEGQSLNQSASVRPAVRFEQVRNVLIVITPEEQATTLLGPSPEHLVESPTPVMLGPSPAPAPGTAPAAPSPVPALEGPEKAPLVEAPPAWADGTLDGGARP